MPMKLFSAIRSLASLGSRRRDAESPPGAVRVWDVIVGSTVLGHLTFLSYETPWITASFTPTAHFQKWVPLLEWEQQQEVTDDGEDEEKATAHEVELLLMEANTAGGLVAVEREDLTAPNRRLFHFNEDFTLVSFR